MPHQCVHCGEVYPDTSETLLKGCNTCGSHFFFFIKKEQMQELQNSPENPVETLEREDKDQIERDVREMIGIEREDVPVILDLESVKVLGPGKFALDIVNIFNKKRPLIYKLEEGKYIIDLASTLKIELDKSREKEGN